MGHERTPAKSGSARRLVGLAAIAVGVIGAVVTLTTAGGSTRRRRTRCRTAAPRRPRRRAPPPTPAAGGRLEGVAQAPGEAPFAVQVTIDRGLRPERAVRDDPRAEVRGAAHPGPARRGRRCRVQRRRLRRLQRSGGVQAGGGEVLKAGADGTLTYTATYSGATGVLRRP
jgi:hypothetical protein